MDLWTKGSGDLLISGAMECESVDICIDVSVYIWICVSVYLRSMDLGIYEYVDMLIYGFIDLWICQSMDMSIYGFKDQWT